MPAGTTRSSWSRAPDLRPAETTYRGDVTCPERWATWTPRRGDVLVGGPLGRLYRWHNYQWHTISTPDETPLDIRVMLGSRDALPTLMLGAHEIYLGPLMDPPELLQPQSTVSLGHPPSISWTVPDGPVEALNYIHLSNLNGVTMWSIVAPTLRELALPDLATMDGITLLGSEGGSMRFMRALAPNFNIDNYSRKGLSLYRWRAWATQSLSFPTH